LELEEGAGADRQSSKQSEWEAVFMKLRIVHFFQIWSKEWGLTAFLVLLIVLVFIVAPIVHLGVVGRWVMNVFFSFLLISGVAAVSERRSLTVLSTGLVVVTIGLRWMAHATSSPAIESASAFSTIVCLGLLAGVVIAQVFGKGPITGHRIQGAIAVYLLLGLMWAIAYHLVLLQNPGAFQPAILGERRDSVMPDLFYFSFVTLTTVGYGDITPVDPMARSLATLEALVGQLYPAILIGRLVAMELSSRQSR